MTTTVTIEYDPTNDAARKLIEAVKASGLMVSFTTFPESESPAYPEIDPVLLEQLMKKSLEQYRKGEYLNPEALLKEIETW